MFVFEKKKVSRDQGYSARIVRRGKSLAFVIPTKIMDRVGLVRSWNYQIGAKFDGEFPVLIVSKCGVPKEVEDYIWELKPSEVVKEGEDASKYRFLLPTSEETTSLINRECPTNEYSEDNDFIYFTLSKEFVGRKKVDPEDLTIDLDED